MNRFSKVSACLEHELRRVTRVIFERVNVGGLPKTVQICSIQTSPKISLLVGQFIFWGLCLAIRAVLKNSTAKKGGRIDGDVAKTDLTRGELPKVAA